MKTIPLNQRLITALALSLSLLTWAAAPALGDTAIFINPNNTIGNWGASGNWYNDYIPKVGDDVVTNELLSGGAMSIQTTNRTVASFTHGAGATGPVNPASFYIRSGTDNTNPIQTSLTVGDFSTLSGAITLTLRSHQQSGTQAGTMVFSVTNNFTVNSTVNLGSTGTSYSSNTTGAQAFIGSINVGGTTTINTGGTLSFTNVYNFVTSTANNANLGDLVIGGGTLNLTSGSTASNGTNPANEVIVSAKSLSGNSGTIRANKANTKGALRISGEDDTSFAGTIVDGEGTVRLIVDGEGSLTLSGANTYTGTTSVLSGTLIIDETGSISTSSNFIIGDSGTLSRIGSLTLPSEVTIGVSSANGAGLITATEQLIYGGTLTFDVAGSVGSGSWLVFDFNSFDGEFDSVLLSGYYEGELEFSDGLWAGEINGRDWTFDPTLGTLTVVPEPALAGVILALLSCMVLLRRRT